MIKKWRILFSLGIMVLVLFPSFSFAEQTCKLTSTGFSFAPLLCSGNKIVFATCIDADWFYLASVNTDGSGFMQLSNTDLPSMNSNIYRSADGSKIYYSCANNDLYNIWRVNPDGSGKEMIYQAASQYTIGSFSLSPDDSKVAFLLRDLTYNTLGLWVMNSDGSSPLQLTNAQYPGGIFSASLSWDHSSNAICYQTSNWPAYWRKINANNTGDTGINIVSNCFYLDCSPIGDTIAFVCGSDICLLKEDGTNTVQLTFNQGTSAGMIKWSPDGAKILYSSGNTICVMNADGSNTKILGTAFGGSWSSDSARVVYGDFQDIYMVNADGTNLQNITNNPLPVAIYSPVAWSGDSSRFLYYSSGPFQSGFYIADKDGANKRLFLSSPSSFSGAAPYSWAPHPYYILCTEMISPFPPLSYIYSKKDDATDTKILYISSHSSQVGNPVWSPDLSKIAFSDSGDIWVMDSDGSNTVDLTNTSDTYESFAVWSPDGNSIAYFAYNNTNGFDLWTINSNGSGQTNLTMTGFNSMFGVTSPVWSPDGTKIAFGIGNGYYMINKDGTGMTVLSNLPLLYYSLPPPCWKNNSTIYVLAPYGANIPYICTVNSNGTDLQKFSAWIGWSSSFPLAMLSPDRDKVIYAKGINLYMTDFSGNSAPLGLVSARTRSETAIDVYFSDSLDPATVQISDFTVDGSIIINTSCAENTVTLILQAPIAANARPGISITSRIEGAYGIYLDTGSLIPADGIAPKLEHISLLTQQIAAVAFSETMLPGAALSSPANYATNVNGGADTFPVSVDISANPVVKLTYGSQVFNFGDTVQVTVPAILEDQASNAINTGYLSVTAASSCFAGSISINAVSVSSALFAAGSSGTVAVRVSNAPQSDTVTMDTSPAKTSLRFMKAGVDVSGEYAVTQPVPLILAAGQSDWCTFTITKAGATNGDIGINIAVGGRDRNQFETFDNTGGFLIRVYTDAANTATQAQMDAFGNTLSVITIPGNSLDTDALVLIENSASGTEADAVIRANGGLLRYCLFVSDLAGTLRSINALALSDTSTHATFPSTATITLTIYYTGIALPAGLEANLKIYRLTGNQWVLVAGTQTVDTVKKCVTVTINGFSVYRLLTTSLGATDLSGVIVYPNPVKPGIGQTLTFKGLTALATIRIYNITGELVRTIDETDGDGMNVWDLRNDQNEPVASGVYIYFAANPQDQTDRSTGKIMVIR